MIFFLRFALRSFATWDLKNLSTGRTLYFHIQPFLFDRKQYIAVRTIYTQIFHFLFSFFTNKKRHIPKKCPSLRLVLRCNIHIIGMCHTSKVCHADSKSILQHVFFEVPVQRWTFTISLPFFIQLPLFFYISMFSTENTVNIFSAALNTPLLDENVKI